MPKDLLIILDDHPGTLAVMGEALGKAGVNIDGMCGIPCNNEGNIHVLVEDASTARMALEAQGMKVARERDVLVLEIKDEPGEFGKVARKIADAGVNIDLVYLASNNKLVLGADDLEKAKAAI